MTEVGTEPLLGTLLATAPDLLAYFERRVDPRDAAADLLSEAMVQAWRRSDSAPVDVERCRMWLFVIARNILSNHARTTRRRHALADRLRQHLSEHTPPTDPAEALAVREAVRRLPSGQRELVMLIHWDGFSIKEAGELLEIGASTARSRYAAARSRLAEELSETAAVVDGSEPDKPKASSGVVRNWP
jgi:RNA polymerase sigma-70 factor (ECF subfamily)